MKSEDILKNLGEVSPEYVSRAAKTTGTKKTAWVKWAAAAACFCVCLGGAVFFLRERQGDDRWPVETVYVGGESTTEATMEAVVEVTELGTYVEPQWNDKRTPEQFRSFQWNGTEYGISPREEPLNDADVGEVLGEVTLMGYDIYADTYHEASGTAFEVRGISPDCALGIRFEDSDSVYVYTNRWYSPETLEDFASDLNFEENLIFGGASFSDFDEDGNYFRVEFEDFDDGVIWEKLLSDPSLENLGDVNSVSMLTVSASHKLLGYENMALCICDDGNVWTNIMGTMKTFFVGEDKTEAFVEWVKDKVPGKKLVFVYPETEESEATEATDMGEETVVAFTSSGYDPNANVTTSVSQEPGEYGESYVNENGEMISPPYDPNQN